MKTFLAILALLCATVTFAQTSNAPPEPSDTFTTRATCRIDTANGVYIYYEDGQHGLYKGMTAKQLKLGYAPKCGFALPENALSSIVLPTKAQAKIENVSATTAPTVEWPKIKSISGPCSQIVGNLCYNAYTQDGKTSFGFYSFDDKDQKVTMIETFDCKHPNGRKAWESGSTYPVYNSEKVAGLYESCYGDVP